ncbi:hypothetical protein CYMTET_32217, partial [Cymbomonas tetramitiformis]
AMEAAASPEAHRRPVAMCTFGQPRVGNDQFADIFTHLVPNAIRMVCKGDVVTTVPKSGFKHVGTHVTLLGGGGYQIAQKGGWADLMNRFRTGFSGQDHLILNYLSNFAMCEEWLYDHARGEAYLEPTNSFGEARRARSSAFKALVSQVRILEDSISPPEDWIPSENWMQRARVTTAFADWVPSSGVKLRFGGKRSTAAKSDPPRPHKSGALETVDVEMPVVQSRGSILRRSETTSTIADRF